MKNWTTFFTVTGLWWAGLLQPAAQAQTTLNAPTTSQAPKPSATPLGPPWSLNLNVEYTGGSKVYENATLGHQAESRYEVEALRNFQLTGNYYLQVGFDYERYDFSRSNERLPYSLTGANAEISFSYWSGDSYYPVLEIEPGVYYTRDHITKNSFDVPIRFTPGLQVSDNLYLIMGFSLDVFNSPVVFPIGGFNWKINDQWNFRGVFPRPRISYNPNKKLELYLEGELTGAGYRNGPTTDRRTNNAILEYSEYRMGLGADYTVSKSLDVEAVAGWTFERDFDYIRSGPVNDSKGAPYIRLDVSISLF